MRPLLIRTAIAASFVAMGSPAALASDQAGTIKEVHVRASDGLVYFVIENTARTAAPACATHEYWIIKDENSGTGRRQLALLLTAKASGQRVSIKGMGTCVRWIDGEDVDEVILAS